MHIVQLANFYGPTSGGLRVAVDELAVRYRAAGHRTTLIVPGPRDSIERAGHRTDIVIKSPVAPGLGGYRVIVDRRAVRAALGALRPDVIELSDKTTLAGVATGSRTAGVPVVLISHERLDLVVREALGERSIVRRGIVGFNRRLARRIDGVVFASRFAASEPGWEGAPQVRHIPLGVDLDVFRPRNDGSARTNEPARLIAVVRLSPEKRPDLLIDTARQLVARGVDFEMTVLGEGPLGDDLRACAADLPIRFLGHRSDRAEVAAEIGDADVGLAPGPHETFGLAALEMLACGTPIVVPDSGALPELVDDAIGRVAASDGVAFADAVASLLACDRVEQRRAARRHAERFDWDATAAAMLDLFGDLLIGPGERVVA